MTLLVGGANIGAGDWGAGVIVPIGFNIGHDVQLSLSPEIDAAANETGRHLASSSVVSLSRPPGRRAIRHSRNPGVERRRPVRRNTVV
jgi:hypothetical protein